MSKRKRKGNVWVARMTDFKDDYKLRGDDPSDTVERVFWSRADAERCISDAKLEVMKETIENEDPRCFALVGLGPESGKKWPRNYGWGGKDCLIREKYYDGAKKAAAQAKVSSDEALLETWDDFSEGYYVSRRYSYHVEALEVE